MIRLPLSLLALLGLIGPAAAASICVPGDEGWFEKACYSDEEAAPTYGRQWLGGMLDGQNLRCFTGLGRKHWLMAAVLGTPFCSAGGGDTIPRINDLDGDGYVELAYIDRPHFAKPLRV